MNPLPRPPAGQRGRPLPEGCPLAAPGAIATANMKQALDQNPIRCSSYSGQGPCQGRPHINVKFKQNCTPRRAYLDPARALWKSDEEPCRKKNFLKGYRQPVLEPPLRHGRDRLAPLLSAVVAESELLGIRGCFRCVAYHDHATTAREIRCVTIH